MSTTRQQLRDIQAIAARLHADWTRFTETSDDLATSGDHLGVHGGDTPDPTIAGVYANTTVTNAAAAISEALGALKEAERLTGPVMLEHPETARLVAAAKRAARCADPVCDELVAKHGYCERHWWDHRETCVPCRSGASA